MPIREDVIRGGRKSQPQAARALPEDVRHQHGEPDVWARHRRDTPERQPLILLRRLQDTLLVAARDDAVAQ